MTTRTPKRPATPDPAQPAKDWAPCDPATVAPTVTKNGETYPDLYNNAASRNVSREEAIARGWKYYQDGSTCRAGHISSRPVSNSSACTDCHRVKRGLPPIGATARHQKFNAPGAGRPSATAPAAPAPAAAPAPREPDARDKRFLAALAEHRDPEKACAAIGATRPGIDARLSYDPAFRDAVRDLCERMLIAWTLPALPTSFEWTQAKRQQFIQVWVDTGDIATAREAIGCTPSAYFEELESNGEFAESVDRARPRAAAALEDRAHQLALAGNSKLLEKLLAAKKPEEYGEKLRVDLNVQKLEKLTDDQLQQRIESITKRYGFRIARGVVSVDAVDGEIIEKRQDAAAHALGASGGAGQLGGEAPRLSGEHQSATHANQPEKAAAQGGNGVRDLV